VPGLRSDIVVIDPIGIQMHRMYAFPVAFGAFPAQRITLAGVLVERRASIQDVLIEVRMALGRRDEPDRAVTMFVVVPAHLPGDPRACGEQGIERLQRISGPVLQRFEQRFRIRIVLNR